MYVEPIDKATAKEIIVANHYSKTWNTPFGAYNFGVFSDDGRLLGAAVFGHLMNPKSYKSIARVKEGQIIELNRLWIDDELGRNTESQVLSKSMKWLRANTDIQIVQSFSDGRLGVGKTYQASNFGYYGYSTTQFFRHKATGRVYHHTAFTNTAALRTMIDRNHMWIRGELETFKVNTYRYLRPLTKYGRRAIILKEQPYPPYQKGEIPFDPPWEQSLTALARCEVGARLLGDPRADEFLRYMERLADRDAIEEARELARNNRFIQDAVAKHRKATARKRAKQATQMELPFAA